MKLGHLLYAIINETDLDSAMDCFPSHTQESQKIKIRSQLENAILKFKELPIEEQNKYQCEHKTPEPVFKKEEVEKVEKAPGMSLSLALRLFSSRSEIESARETRKSERERRARGGSESRA
jgi:hypothetical protein